ncbi:hypothetical protein VNI00_013444 [Paramarasmius palmivorus]|uniref:Uncharacterized protein n=1 Tax=Paramarasmius palmivorus TaxID=297713 RepID=A0AAW0BZM2_9AGAR
MAPTPRAESTAATNEPNVPLIVGLTITAVVLLLLTILATVYFRRRSKQKKERPRPASLDPLTSQQFREREKYLSPHPPHSPDAPLINQSTGDSFAYDPYESYPSPGHSRSDVSSYQHHLSGNYDDAENRGLLSKTPSPHPSPFMEAFELNDRQPSPSQSRRHSRDRQSLSLSPKDLPRLVIPTTPTTPGGTRTLPIPPAQLESAVEANLVAPGASGSGSSTSLPQRASMSLQPPPRPLSEEAETAPTPSPRTLQPTAASPNPIPESPAESDAETESLYSQFSASTTRHNTLAFDVADAPPVPPIPTEYLASTQPTQPLSLSYSSPQQEEQEADLHRVPTKVISSLLKSRARGRGGRRPGGLTREVSQISHISRIERAGSIDSYLSESDGEADEDGSGKREARRMRTLSRVSELSDLNSDLYHRSTHSHVNANEPLPEEQELPNPFDRSLVSTPATSTMTISYNDASHYSAYTPPLGVAKLKSYHEHPNLEVESRSVFSEEAHVHGSLRPLKGSVESRLSKFEV